MVEGAVDDTNKQTQTQQGIGVLDVVMMPRGEAIVVFNTVMDCQMALGRDRYVCSRSPVCNVGRVGGLETTGGGKGMNGLVS